MVSVPLISNSINGFREDILINNMLLIFLTNSFVTPFLWFLSPEYWYLLFKRRRVEQMYHKGEVHMRQRNLNTLFENPDIDIGLKYSFLANTVLMSVFFIHLFPLGTLISGVGVTFAFFIDKVYNLK